MRCLSMAMCCAWSMWLVPAADAQLFFDSSMDVYHRPQSEWERWSRTKPGTAVEYHDQDGRLWVRFVLLKVGDRELTLEATKPNPFPNQPPMKSTIRQVFDGPETTIGRGTITKQQVAFGEREAPGWKESFIAGEMPVKNVWYADDAPFDGMVKYEQYQLGKLVTTITAKYDVGEAKPEPKTTVAQAPQNEPQDPPVDEAAAEPPAARVWTSADGKFKVEATLVKVEQGTVHLRRNDTGKVIQVPLTKLSFADRRAALGK